MFALGEGDLGEGDPRIRGDRQMSFDGKSGGREGRMILSPCGRSLPGNEDGGPCTWRDECAGESSGERAVQLGLKA